MYTSKYYTNPEIDERLLQGYYDDLVKAGFVGTINELWALVLSIANKVDKKEGYGLSQNDFTDLLLAKLNGIEEKANYITKVSELINDSEFQTKEQVEEAIEALVNGANDALDTLKELAEALGNDPNFANTITNKLTELRTALTEEVNRAKEKEAELAISIKDLKDQLNSSVGQVIDTVNQLIQSIQNTVNELTAKVEKNRSDISDLNQSLIQKHGEALEFTRNLVEEEEQLRETADNTLNDKIHALEVKHTEDIGTINGKIESFEQSITQGDLLIDSKLNEEIANRRADDQNLLSKIEQEKVDRRAEDDSLSSKIDTEVANRTNADSTLQINIDKEAQLRTAADSVLQTNIDSEANTRLAQDEILDHKIGDVMNLSNSIKTELLVKISEEKDARIAADNTKVDKREGYSLTKNDFTDLLLAKLNGIEEKANYITKVSELINDSEFQTKEQVEEAVQKVIGTAPEILDTLGEIAEALGNDANFTTTITKKLAALSEQINEEKEAREAGDANTLTKVNEEVEARKAADQALKSELKSYIDNKDTLTNDALSDLETSLNKEVQDRKEADTAIRESLSTEIADRKAADQSITTSLNQVNTRVSELTLSIQEAINNVKNELTTKVSANTTAIATHTSQLDNHSKAIQDLEGEVSSHYQELKDMVNEEVVDRTNADSSLSSRIDTLNIDLNTEKVERKAASEVLNINLAKEVEDRKAADIALKNTLEGQITISISNTNTEIGKINDKLTQEKEARIAADHDLEERITNLETGNSSASSEILEKIHQNTLAIEAEKTRAMAKEDSLTGLVNTSIQNHRDDVAAIRQELLTEKNNRLNGDSTLQNKIDQEISDRKHEDTLINTTLAQEVANRKAAVEALQSGKVSVVEGKTLSQNDFTDLLLAKLNGIEEKANYITKVSELINDSEFQNQEQVQAEIQKVIGAAPEVLNTLSEIAQALSNDPHFATTITNKLTELTNKIEAEEALRVQGDNRLQELFTNLSNTTNTLVQGLKELVNSTRSELIISMNAANTLITQNAANIQRNLELIQGIQGNINGNYTAIKDIVESEILARKAEDIRLEAKIDGNTQALQTEVEDRKAADLVLQSNIDEEVEARKAADQALDTKVNKEIQDRVTADQALDTKFTGITSALGQRIAAEEAVTGALPGTMVTEVSGLTRNASQLSFQVKTANKGNNGQYGEATSSQKNILAATRTLAGALSAEDKVKLDGLDPNSIVGITPGATAEKVTLTIAKDNGVEENTTQIIDMPIASDTSAGSMSAKDKGELDAINTANYTLGTVVPNDKVVVVNASKTNITTKVQVPESISIPSVTTSKAGVMAATDKAKLDRASTANYALGDPTSDATKVNIVGTKVNLANGSSSNESKSIPAATQQKAGVMAAADKVKLDVTLPNAIAQEAIDRQAAIEAAAEGQTTALNKEIQDRKDADNLIHSRIQSETESLHGRCDSLSNQIDQEHLAWAQADESLGSLINTNTIDLMLLKNSKGQPDGIATLGSDGKVPAAQLPSYVDDVVEVYATYNTSSTGQLSNIKLYTTAAHTTQVTGTAGKVYIDITSGHPGYSFRWTGSAFAPILSSGVVIGTVEGTAFDGAKGQKIINGFFAKADSFVENVSLGSMSSSGIVLNVVKGAIDKENTSYLPSVVSDRITIPNVNDDRSGLASPDMYNDYMRVIPNKLSQLQSSINTNKTEVDRKLNSLPNKIVDHLGVANSQNPNYVAITTYFAEKQSDGTYSVIPENGATGWSFVRINGATSTQAGIMTAADKAKLDKVVTDLASETTTRANADIELRGYIDSIKSELNSRINIISNNLNTHIALRNNPHVVTATQIGLGNVNNTSDMDKPISTAQGGAIADAKAAGTTAQTQLNTHINRKDNPHVVTRAQLGLATTDQVVFAKTTAPSGFFKESDIRLKSEVEDLNYTLDQICNIPTKSFNLYGEREEGTIAQELESLGFENYVREIEIPEEYTNDSSQFKSLGNGYIKVKAVDYAKMSVLAIEGIKLLKDEIETLKQEINKLRK